MVELQVAGWASSAMPSASAKKMADGAGRQRIPKISSPAGQDLGPADMGEGGKGGLRQALGDHNHHSHDVDQCCLPLVVSPWT